MKKILAKLLVTVVSAFGVASSQATVVAQNADGIDSGPASYSYEDSFRTPSDFFRFYSNASATASSGAGVAFTLSQPYTGAPVDLNTTTSGFLGGSAVVSTVASNLSRHGPQVEVPLPEPSSETAIYVLGGIVGLGWVVIRRRRVA